MIICYQQLQLKYQMDINHRRRKQSPQYLPDSAKIKLANWSTANDLKTVTQQLSHAFLKGL